MPTRGPVMARLAMAGNATFVPCESGTRRAGTRTRKEQRVVPGMRVGVPDSPAGTFKARACAHQNGKASPPGVPAGECGTPTRRPSDRPVRHLDTSIPIANRSCGINGLKICSMKISTQARRGADANGTTPDSWKRVGVRCGHPAPLRLVPAPIKLGRQARLACRMTVPHTHSEPDRSSPSALRLL